ncbi:gamma-crystallin N [Sceloporus undulatus]|uniref:gamma-crystallin N n=1 Tax=Sceloporus undulatus TaxID=8520 RepID=UPI001C4B086A|nr:gamma-crystallin N [Sceloporus undulatus]
MSQYSGKIVFYDGKCFTGKKLEICGPCHNFQEWGFTNQVNSICVQTGAWVCFSYADYRGQQYILEHGVYPSFYHWNAHNDRIGSCKPIGMHGEHYRIEVYEGRHFSGCSEEFTEDCSYLSRQGWPKNWINAIKVYGDGAWVLYEEPNYRGQMYMVEMGDYSSCHEWQAPNANIQSIRRVINYF